MVIPEMSDRTNQMRHVLEEFMDAHIYPNEARFFAESTELGPWAVWPVVEELKALAKQTELWNAFYNPVDKNCGLSNLEYAPLGARGFQLLRSRYWEYGGVGKIWNTETTGTMASSAFKWRNSIHVLYDRTSSSFK